MKNYIRTTHEEEYSTGTDKTSRVIGILTDYNMDDNRINSFPYIFREDDIVGTYIFFDTMIDMIDYLLYGDKKVKRAYMKEKDFDELYDNTIDNEFETYLKWNKS